MGYLLVVLGPVHQATVHLLGEGGPQEHGQLLPGEPAVAVHVDHGEGLLEVFLAEQLVSLDGGCLELRVVDEARVVLVDAAEQLVDVRGRHLRAGLRVRQEELLPADHAVPVFVNELELLDGVLALFLRSQQVRHEAHDALLKSVYVFELRDVRYRLLQEDLVVGIRVVGVVQDPRVLQRLPSTDPFAGVELEQFGDQVFCVCADEFPDPLLHDEGPGLDFGEDLLVGPAVEGRLSRQHDEEDHAAGPDVALVVVVLFEDLRGYVVRLAV